MTQRWKVYGKEVQGKGYPDWQFHGTCRRVLNGVTLSMIPTKPNLSTSTAWFVTSTTTDPDVRSSVNHVMTSSDIIGATKLVKRCAWTVGRGLTAIKRSVWPAVRRDKDFATGLTNASAAWVGRARYAPNASSIPDVKTGHVTFHGSVTVWKAGEACFVTKT